MAIKSRGEEWPPHGKKNLIRTLPVETQGDRSLNRHSIKSLANSWKVKCRVFSYSWMMAFAWQAGVEGGHRARERSMKFT